MPRNVISDDKIPVERRDAVLPRLHGCGEILAAMSSSRRVIKVEAPAESIDGGPAATIRLDLYREIPWLERRLVSGPVMFQAMVERVWKWPALSSHYKDVMDGAGVDPSGQPSIPLLMYQVDAHLLTKWAKAA